MNRLNTSANSVSSFLPPLHTDAGAGPVGLAAGDLDGDGRLDLVVASATDHRVTVFLNASQ